MRLWPQGSYSTSEPSPAMRPLLTFNSFYTKEYDAITTVSSRSLDVKYLATQSQKFLDGQ